MVKTVLIIGTDYNYYVKDNLKYCYKTSKHRTRINTLYIMPIFTQYIITCIVLSIILILIISLVN